jgi:hypothetical protein
MISHQSQLNQMCTYTSRNAQTGAINGVSVDPFRDWVKIVSAGALVKGDHKKANPWNYLIIDTSSYRGRIDEIFNNIGHQSWEGNLVGSLSVAAPGQSLVNANAQALDRLNEKVRGSLDIATSLAEAGQTVKMLNLTKRLVDGMREMKSSYKKQVLSKLRQKLSVRNVNAWQRGLARRYPGSFRPVPVNPGIMSRATAAAANGWCEFTYGWSPLISDIHGIANNVVRHTRNECRIIATSTYKLNERSQVWLNPGRGTGIYRCDQLYSGFIKVKYQIRLNTGFDDDLARWTTFNPLSVAYELAPYSFVLDWFYDLGGYMRNLETACLYGCYFKDGFKSTLSSLTVNQESRETHKTTWAGELTNSVFSSDFRVTSRRVQFDRIMLSSYPKPTLPSFQVDLGSNQLLSAAALLRQLLR